MRDLKHATFAEKCGDSKMRFTKPGWRANPLNTLFTKCLLEGSGFIAISVVLILYHESFGIATQQRKTLNKNLLSKKPDFLLAWQNICGSPLQNNLFPKEIIIAKDCFLGKNFVV